MTAELSETLVTEALAKMSWDLLKEHLTTIQLTQKETRKLSGLIQRSESLLLKRTNAGLEKKRDRLLKNLADFFSSKGLPTDAQFVVDFDKRLKEIDGGYKDILAHLAKTDAAKLRPELRVAALLERSNHEYSHLHVRTLEAMKQHGVLDLGKALLHDEHGRNINSAAVHEQLIATFASTLGMEAHINGWYDADGVLILPSLPLSTTEDRYAVGSVQVLALSWRYWQIAERRHRYLGGRLERQTELDQGWIDNGITSIWVSAPADAAREFYDYAANSRLVERLSQHWLSVISNSKYRNAIENGKGKVELLPKQTVSLEEIHGATALSQLLSGGITDDPTEYAGLRLEEWVRGYAALQTVCQTAFAAGDADNLTIRYSRTSLVALLERLGLQNGKAEIFIDHVTYKKASRDLFDQPLIKLADGTFVLLALSAATSSIPVVILSTLGMLGVNLDARGKRFENAVIKFLGRQGIEAKNIFCKRDGAQYDYDVAFVWGEYLFLLECKSRGLSGGDPTRAYYFSLGIRQAVKQVKRLAAGLEQYPDILTEHFPQAVGKKVVYCVINSLPYAKFNDEDDGGDNDDGILFTDEGSFTRFFQQSEIGPRSLGRESGLGEIDPDSAVAFLWDGDSPTPEDLLRYLKKPIQLVIEGSRTELSPVDLPCGEHTYLHYLEFRRQDSDIASHRDAAKEAGYRTGNGPSETVTVRTMPPPR
jgi:hypothetical protein